MALIERATGQDNGIVVILSILSMWHWNGTALSCKSHTQPSHGIDILACIYLIITCIWITPLISENRPLLAYSYSLQVFVLKSSGTLMHDHLIYWTYPRDGSSIILADMMHPGSSLTAVQWNIPQVIHHYDVP